LCDASGDLFAEGFVVDEAVEEMAGEGFEDRGVAREDGVVGLDGE
jgi:hypothetical protein